MKLIPNWRQARRYWSVRLAVLTAAVAALESACEFDKNSAGPVKAHTLKLKA